MDLRHDIRVGEAMLEAAQHFIQRSKVQLVFSDPAQVQKRRQFDTRKKSKAGGVEAAGVVIQDFLRKMEQRVRAALHRRPGSDAPDGAPPTHAGSPPPRPP